MKRPVLLLVISIFLAVIAPAQTHFKVFLLSGQSNCNGNVTSNDLPWEMNNTHFNIKCWIGETIEDLCLNGEPCPAPRTNVRSWQALSPGWGYDWTGFSGPELSMAYTLSKAYPNDNIAIIKHNRPGQALHGFFRPPSSGGTVGQGYTNIVNTVNTALTSIGGTYEIVGMGWIQGESDMMENKGAEYETHLRNFITDLRSAFNAPKMSFAIAQTIPNWGDATQGPLVRNAQQKVADEMKYVGIFDPSTDKARFPIGVNDNHFVSPGSTNLGIDLANVLINEIQQINVESQSSSGNGKQVGIAYSPWHPNAVWSDAAVATNAVCAWAKPQLGYYRSDDISVIDQHTDWLTDAGIDFVTMDWSNNCGTQNQWLEAYTEVFVDRQVWRKNNGLPFLYSAIMIGCPFDEAANTDGRMSAEVDVVKANYIDHPTRGDVYYKHREKPLVVVYQNGNWNYNSWDHSKFDAEITIRNMFATLVQNPNMHDPVTMRSVNGLWSWSENVHPPSYAYDGRPEFMSAHAALRTCGWWGPESYNQVDAGLQSCIDAWGGAKGRRNGETLRESFAYATQYDVDVVQVMAFNEWTGCENSHGEQRNPEYSNDIEPMEGGHGDLYLRIMKEEIYKFKGWDINNPPSTTTPNYWHFSSSMENWGGMNQITASATSSIATLTINDADPYMHSPDNLNISASDYQYVVVSIQNQTSATTAELFWTTNSSTGYDGTKMVQFPVVANDTEQRTYIIDLSANANWNGIIKQIRLDPTTASSGTVKIDYIKFVGTQTVAPIAIPGTLQAEDFNKGGQGNAYNDADVTNNGGQYRSSEGVDIETTGDDSGTFNIGWTAADEWTEYLVEVLESGYYTVGLRAAAPDNGAKVQLQLDGENLGQVIELTNTGNFQVYSNNAFTAQLTSGLHILKVKSLTGGYNLNYISFQKNTPIAITPYTQINGGQWNQSNFAQVCAQGDVSFGPHPNVASGWSWTGPNGFTAKTREISFEDIESNKSGDYIATYSDPNAGLSTESFTIDVLELPTATVTTSETPQNLQTGSVTFDFQDNPDRTNIAFSINDGADYTSVADNSGSYTFGDLAAGNYALWARWGNKECPVFIGNYEITETITTTIADNESLDKVLIYPNPAKDNFTVVLPYVYSGSTIELNNMLGQKVYAAIASRNSITIAVNHLPDGIYWLEVQNNVYKISINR